MKCSSCGHELSNTDTFCSKCGARIEQPNALNNESPKNDNKSKNSTLAILAFVFAFLCPIAGLILGIIDFSYRDNRKRGLATAAVIIGGIFTAIIVIAMVKTKATTSNPKSAYFDDSEIEYEELQFLKIKQVFKKNPSRAKEIYKGKYVEATGVIDDITSSGNCFVLRQGEDWALRNTAWCTLYSLNEENKNKFNNYDIGDTITIHGKITNVDEYTICDIEVIDIVEPPL